MGDFLLVLAWKASRRNPRLPVAASAHTASQSLNWTRYLSHSRAHTSLHYRSASCEETYKKQLPCIVNTTPNEGGLCLWACRGWLSKASLPQRAVSAVCGGSLRLVLAITLLSTFRYWVRAWLQTTCKCTYSCTYVLEPSCPLNCTYKEWVFSPLPWFWSSVHAYNRFQLIDCLL